MTPQERKLIDELFDRLASLENIQRDPDAVGAINDGLRNPPNALYPLVQTALVQDEALQARRRPHPRARGRTRHRRAPTAAAGRLPRQHARCADRQARAAARLGAAGAARRFSWCRPRRAGSRVAQHHRPAAGLPA